VVFVKSLTMASLPEVQSSRIVTTILMVSAVATRLAGTKSKHVPCDTPFSGRDAFGRPRSPKAFTARPPSKTNPGRRALSMTHRVCHSLTYPRAFSGVGLRSRDDSHGLFEQAHG